MRLATISSLVTAHMTVTSTKEAIDLRVCVCVQALLQFRYGIVEQCIPRRPCGYHYNGHVSC